MDKVGLWHMFNKVNANREATLKVKAPAALAALRKTTLFWKHQGAMKATGGDAFVFHYSVVLCSTASWSVQALAFCQRRS